MIRYILDRLIPRKYYKTGRIYWDSYAEAFAYWDEIDEWDERKDDFPQKVWMTRNKFMQIPEFMGE